jgi:uncharacterized protein (UPF0305 family)
MNQNLLDFVWNKSLALSMFASLSKVSNSHVLYMNKVPKHPLSSVPPDRYKIKCKAKENYGPINHQFNF